jgi:WD40 repeat protein
LYWPVCGIRRVSNNPRTGSNNLKNWICLAAVFTKVSFVQLLTTNYFISKKGIYIIDLEEPWETSKTLYQKGKWEISVAQWNPHPSKASWIASGAGLDLLIWNLEDRRSALQGIVQAHQRAVADINWSVFEPNILASCSADTYINVWDVREAKSCLKMRSFCAWTGTCRSAATALTAHSGSLTGALEQIQPESAGLRARRRSADLGHTREYRTD